MVDVSIIIVNYNTFNSTKKCIESIYEFTNEINFEVILVDNNSKDQPIEKLLDVFPRILLIKNDENLGFGIANNIGAERASGEFVLFLNSDTLFIDDVLSKSVFRAREQFKGVNIFGVKQIDENGEVNDSYAQHLPKINHVIARDMSIFKKLFFISNPEKSHSFNDTKNVQFIYGCFLLIRKEAFDQISGFDEDFFLYCEEVDLQWRMNQSNFYFGDLSIVHVGGVSGEGKSDLIMKQILASEMLLFYKHSLTDYLLGLLLKIIHPFITLFLLIFMKKENRKLELKLALREFSLFPTYLSCLRYSRKPNSRNYFLKLKEFE